MAKPPAETHTVRPDRRGRWSERKRSMPGFASPIAFSIPTSVSAMRTGGFPPRGSGVTVFVTKASSSPANSGAVSASRQPLALSSRKDRSLHTQSSELAADLDRAAVAGAVAARHRRLPRELRMRCEVPDGLQHRLGPAGEHVVAGGHDLGHV